MRRWIAIVLLACCPCAVPAQTQTDEHARQIASKVAPAYPELARRLNLDGIVKLRVTVAPDGSARQAEVLGGNPVFTKAAQDAVIKWKWTAAPQETKEIIELKFHPR